MLPSNMDGKASLQSSQRRGTSYFSALNFDSRASDKGCEKIFTLDYHRRNTNPPFFLDLTRNPRLGTDHGGVSS